MKWIKVKAEQDTDFFEFKPTMGDFDLTGTKLIGYFPDGTTYQQLVSAFGEPQYLEPSGDGKIKCEWNGKIGGDVFSIYDYKSEDAPENNTEWHIGGHDRETCDRVLKYFESHS